MRCSFLWGQYYTCSFSKLRYKAHQKVWKCSLTFPLLNGIITFYENCTNKYVRVDKLVPSGYLGYLWYMYNFWMTWVIITIYISKCAQKDPPQFPKTSKFYSRCKVWYQKTVRGGYHLPLVAWRLIIIKRRIVLRSSARGHMVVPRKWSFAIVGNMGPSNWNLSPLQTFCRRERLCLKWRYINVWLQLQIITIRMQLVFSLIDESIPCASWRELKEV